MSSRGGGSHWNWKSFTEDVSSGFSDFAGYNINLLNNDMLKFNLSHKLAP